MDPSSLARYYLTNTPGTQVYTVAIAIYPPNVLALTYRSCINGQNNEPPGGQNRLRYIRIAGDYTLPLDTFRIPSSRQSSRLSRTPRGL
jgi:hypothetical protein